MGDRGLPAAEDLAGAGTAGMVQVPLDQEAQALIIEPQHIGQTIIVGAVFGL